MVSNQKIISSINQQIGNEFSAMLQYYAIAAHFAAEALPELSAHFQKQAEEEKGHALRFIQFVIDTGSRVTIPAVPAPEAHFKAAEDAIKLSLEQEERVTTQINALVHYIRDLYSNHMIRWLYADEQQRIAPAI